MIIHHVMCGGCAGIYTAHAAMELYAEAFHAAGCLHHLEAFASINGARFYGLPLNDGTIELALSPWTVPASYVFDTSTVVPLRASETIAWKKM
jgi:dihydroorotase